MINKYKTKYNVPQNSIDFGSYDPEEENPEEGNCNVQDDQEI